MSRVSAQAGKPLLIALALCAVIALAFLGLLAFLGPQLPDPVAVHFDAPGAADGFQSRSSLWNNVSIVFGIPAALLAAMLVGMRSQGYTSAVRAVCAVAVGASALTGVLFGIALWVQRGLADAAQARLHNGYVALSFAVAIAAGLGVWFGLPKPEPGAGRPVATPSRPVELSDSEQVVWSRRATAGPMLVWTLIGVVGLLALLAVVLREPWLIGGAVLILLVMAMTCAFRITVDRRGLTWVSMLGIPRGRILLDQIAEAEAVEIEPMQFGGWGLRLMPDAGFGVILRRGPGLRVVRRDGRALTITVDDAATAAGLLQRLTTG